MGNLYLASYQFKKPHSGELVDEKRLIHADITDGSEREKCFVLTDWLEKWFKETYPKEVELTGAKVNTTLDWVAEEKTPKHYPAPGATGYRTPTYSIKYEKNDKVLSDTSYSVFFVKNSDPDNAVIAGYGGSYAEALKDFSEKLWKSEYRLNDDLHIELVV